MSSRLSLPGTVLLSAVCVAAAGLSGCVVEPPRHVERVEVQHITQAPPAPIVEEIPPAPYVDAYWIPGHWAWKGGRYAWNGGHWEQARVNMVYQRAHWSDEHGEWVFHPGRWVELVQQARVAPIVVNVPPPMPRVEVMPPPPGPGHVWIGGYWRWSGSRHEWVAGHWEARRDTAFWVPGHWYRNGGGWAFAGGVWQQY